MSAAFLRPLSLPFVWATLALLAAQVLLALAGVRQQGVTSDETAHLTAGYSYWTLNDYRLQPENGNLPQRWCALPLLVLDPTLDPDRHPRLWALSDVWRIAHDFFFTAGNDSDAFLAAARVAMMFWGVALALIVQGWARHLWGSWSGLLALALAVFSPTVLAHAPLATSDVTTTVCLLGAVGAWWWSSHRLSPTRVLLSGFIIGLAFIAKFSAVLLLPMFGVMALVRILSGEPVVWRWSGRGGSWSSAHAKLAALAGLTALQGLLTVVVIWTAFGWRYEAMNPAIGSDAYFYKTNEITINQDDWVGSVVNWTRDHHLLPQAYIQGFVFVRHHSTARSAFLAGDYRETGWWWYFPAAFFWKSTEGELLVTLALAFGVAAALIRWRRNGRLRAGAYRFTPLLVLGAIYGGVSLASSLNIGQRHILPLYGILFIMAGGLVAILPSPRGRLLLALPVLLSALASLSVSPHFLTYFNHLSGGPTQGWKKMVDSSLDWGQGLPALNRWLAENRHPGETVYLSYLGSDDYRHYPLDAVPLAPIYQNYEPRRFIELKPGLYCITATMLQDVYSPMRGPWTLAKERDYRLGMGLARANLASGAWENRIVDFGREGTELLWQVERLRFSRLMQYLRLRPPDATVANSILVFRLSEREILTMIDGSPSEIADLMDELTARPPD